MWASEKTRQIQEVRHLYLHAGGWKLWFSQSECMWLWECEIHFKIAFLKISHGSLWSSRRAVDHSVCWLMCQSDGCCQSSALKNQMFMTFLHIWHHSNSFCYLYLCQNVAKCIYNGCLSQWKSNAAKIGFKCPNSNVNKIWFLCFKCAIMWLKKCLQMASVTRANIKQWLGIIHSHNCFNSLSCVF